jgi:hypothetical protein
MGARLVFFTSECPTLISPIHLWEDFVKDLEKFCGYICQMVFYERKSKLSVLGSVVSSGKHATKL